MAKKEKQKIFTEMQFNDAQYAQDVLNSSTAKLEKCKIGLIIAAVAQLAWVLMFLFPNSLPDFLVDALSFVALGGTIAAYIVGGGFGYAFKFIVKIGSTIAWIGWALVPFPMDIFTGLFTLMVSIIIAPGILIFIPLVAVGACYYQNSKDHAAAEKYLSYCTPVTPTAVEEPAGE